MKLLGAVLILLATTLFGANEAYKLSSRAAKLERLQHFIHSLCEEIRLTRAELPDVIARLPRGKEYIENGAWHGLEGLKGEDVRVLQSFLSSLGKTDVEGQINNAKLHGEALAERLRDAKEEKRKMSRLYLSLGFLTGAFAVVLII